MSGGASVDLVDDGLVTAAGCNGYAAKSGDAIGAITGQLAIERQWTDPLLDAGCLTLIGADATD